MSGAARVGVVLLVAGLLAAACARSPEAQKARHLERADKYAAREQYKEAIIEYRNVLRYEQANARAMRQLGLLHYRLGELAQAYPYLLKAAALAPDALDVRLKLGALYLLDHKPEAARQEATFVLDKDGKNLEGLALLARAVTRPEDVNAAIQRLQAARADLEDRAQLHLSLAALYVRKRDVPSAERAVQEAIVREPKSVEAHLALANLYFDQRDIAQAERAFKTAADLAPTGSLAQMAQVDFYRRTGKPDEAKRLLSEITQKAPENLPAWRWRAEIALVERNYDESLSALQVILKKNPSDLEGRFLLGRVRLAKRETTEAIQEFQHVLKLEPRQAPARYQLGLAQLQAGNVQQAKVQLKEAIAMAPNFVEAVLLLAELNLQTGAIQPAIEELESFVARQPNMIQAYVLLGSAYLAKREPIRATEVFRKFKTLAPNDPRGPYLVGVGFEAQRKPAEAKREYEAALQLASGYVDPLTRLAAMALADKQPDAALNRVRKQIGLAPKSGALQHLLGTLHLARREPALAERAFLTAIELEPNVVDAYIQLGNLYGTAGRYDDALAKLTAALKVAPQHLSAQMLAGVIYEHKGDITRAQNAYEALLTLNPRFAPAANNLAWLYAEHGGDKEKALELARRAKEAQPDDPRISDTLGWILYKRGIYQQAFGLLKESAAKLPDHPEIQYHFGLASLKVGDKEGARTALSAALNLPGTFAWKAEAREVLTQLK